MSDVESNGISSESRVPSHGRGRIRSWKPGQSGNPGGIGGEYRATVQLARQKSREAMNRLIELMQSSDERVAFMAAEAVLKRAWGNREPPQDDKSNGVRLDLSRLTLDQIKTLAIAVQAGAVSAPALPAAETVIDGVAASASVDMGSDRADSGS